MPLLAGCWKNPPAGFVHLVYLVHPVCIVYPVDLVHLGSFDQPKNQAGPVCLWHAGHRSSVLPNWF
jgi:hypothetical protein